LVRVAARRHLRGLRETGERGALLALSRRSRAFRAHALATYRFQRRPRWRRRDVDHAWPAVRESRRALLDRSWRVFSRFPRTDPGRGRRPSLLELRHLPDCAYEEPA